MGRIWDWIMEMLHGLALAAVAVLPDSPIQTIGADWTGFHTIMRYINYFVPIGGMIAIFTAYLGAVLVYYGVRWVLRITRYID